MLTMVRRRNNKDLPPPQAEAPAQAQAEAQAAQAKATQAQADVEAAYQEEGMDSVHQEVMTLQHQALKQVLDHQVVAELDSVALDFLPNDQAVDVEVET